VTIGALFWPSEDGEPLDDGFEAARRPNGSDDRMPSALWH
jgi:hypothetical protein